MEVKIFTKILKAKEIVLLKIYIVFILIFMSLNSAKANAVCDGDILKYVTGGRDIYFGELHGSNEVPELLKCLIDERIKHSPEKKFSVALELNSLALNPKSDVWFGTDGRHSKAMWELVQHLMNLQKEDKIKIYMFNDLLSSNDDFSQNINDKKIGLSL